MRAEATKILVKMLVNNVIKPAVVSQLLGLTEKQKQAFEQQTSSALVDFLQPRARTEEALQKIIEQFAAKGQHSKKNIGGVAALRTLEELPEWEHAESGEVYTSIPVFLLSVLVASNEYSVERSIHSSIEHDIAHHSTIGTLAQSKTLIKGFIHSEEFAFVGGIAIGASLLIAGIKELHHQFEKKHTEKNLRETIDYSENRYLELMKIYTTISAHFKQALDEVDDIATPLKRKAILTDWFHCEQLIQQEMQEIQQNIALSSALTQQLASTRRVERLYDGFSTAIASLCMVGPPGLIAAGILKSASIAGLFFAKRWVGESAYFNNGVRNNHVFLITDKNSVEQAKNQMLKGANVVLALSGPVIGKKNLAESIQLNTRLLFDTQFDFEPIFRPALDRAFCSFCFNEPLPVLPDPKPPLADQHFTSDPALKKQGKLDMWELVRAQTQIAHEAWYLYQLASGIRKKCEEEKIVLPYIVNLQEQIHTLQNMQQNIHEKMKIIAKQMGKAYYEEMENEGLENEGARGVHQYEKMAVLFDNNIQHLKRIGESMEKASPHTELFHYQQRTEDNHEMKDKLVQRYTDSFSAREMLLKEIEFKLSAIETIVTTCIEQNNGEGISNLGASIKEIYEQLDILRKGCTPKTDTSNPEENKQYQLFLSCCERNRQLCTRQYQLNQNRFDYLQQSEGLLSIKERLSALYQLQYDQENTPRGPDGYSAPQISDEEFATLRSILLEKIDPYLENPFITQLDQLNKTQMIVSPNRAFFGLNKHAEMKISIEEKIAELCAKSIYNIQINPLSAVDEELIALCKKDPRKLQLTLEGIKTEIEWLSQFTQLNHLITPKINIMNLQRLHDYYQHQLNILSAVFGECQNPSISTEVEDKAQESSLAIPNHAQKHTLSAYEKYCITSELSKARTVLEGIECPRNPITEGTHPKIDSGIKRVAQHEGYGSQTSIDTQPGVLNPLDGIHTQAAGSHDENVVGQYKNRIPHGTNTKVSGSPKVSK